MAGDATYTLSLAIDARKGQDGATAFKAATDDVTTSAKKADDGIKKLDVTIAGFGEHSKAVTGSLAQLVAGQEQAARKADELAEVFRGGFARIGGQLAASQAQTVAFHQKLIEDMQAAKQAATTTLPEVGKQIEDVGRKSVTTGNGAREAFVGLRSGLSGITGPGDLAARALDRVSAAQQLVNLAIQGGPWGLLAAGIGATVGLIAHFNREQEKAAENAEKLSHALDGPLSKIREFRAVADIGGVYGSQQGSPILEQLKALQEAAASIRAEELKSGGRTTLPKASLDSLIEGTDTRARYARLFDEYSKYSKTIDSGAAIGILNQASSELKRQQALDDTAAAFKRADAEANAFLATLREQERFGVIGKDAAEVERIRQEAFDIASRRGDADPKAFAYEQAGRAEQRLQDARDEKEAIEAVNEAVAENQRLLDGSYSAQEHLAAVFQREHDAIEKARKSLDDYLDGLREKRDIVGSAPGEAAQLAAFQEAYGRATRAGDLNPLGAALDAQEIVRQTQAAQAAIEAEAEADRNFVEALQDVIKARREDSIEAARHAEAMEQASRRAEEAVRREAEREAREIHAAALRLADSFTSPIASGLEDLLLRTRNYAETLKSVFLDIERAGLRAFLTGPLQQGLSGALAGLFGGQSTGAFTLAGLSSHAYAHGSAFSMGNVVPMANGSVVNGPTYFPLASGRTGLMGEAGSEAVMPLARTSQGDLGVKVAGGAGGGNVTVYMTVYANDAGSFKQSGRQVTDDLRRRLQS